MSTAQRLEVEPVAAGDPRQEVLSKRPASQSRETKARRPTSNGSAAQAATTKPVSNGSPTNGAASNGHATNGSSSTNGKSTTGKSTTGKSKANQASKGASNGNDGPASDGAVVRTAHPLSAPPAPPDLSDPADGRPARVDARVGSPMVGLRVMEPTHAPPVGPPLPIDPGLLPGPAMLAPARVPQIVPIPALFDEDDHPTRALSFDRLFDPAHDLDLDAELDDDDRPQVAPHIARARTLMFTQTGRRRRPRVRRVTRVVRHVDPWSVFKVALCFSLVLYGVCLTAGVLLWNVAYTTGTIDNVQRFFESFGWNTFRFKGGELFHNAWIAGLFIALGLTGLIVLTATLFNLITDLVGGIRITVLEEEVVERTPVVRGPLLRRRSSLIGGPLLGPRPGQPQASEAETDDSDAEFG